MACCPPGSLPASSALEIGEESPPKGTVISFADGSQAYIARPAAGTPLLGYIIMVHDICGWTNGRTQHLADEFASYGYIVIEPDFFMNDYPRVLDIREALKIQWPWDTYRAWRALLYRVIKPWEEVEKKIYSQVLPWLRENGMTEKSNLGAIGICWGGWVITRLAGQLDGLKYGIGIHPTPDNQRLQSTGPTVSEMVDQVRVPLLFLMSWNDPQRWKPEGGHLFERVRERNPGSRTVDFPTMMHGFMNRGDMKLPHVKKEVERGIEEIKTFLSKTAQGTLLTARL